MKKASLHKSRTPSLTIALNAMLRRMRAGNLSQIQSTQIIVRTSLACNPEFIGTRGPHCDSALLGGRQPHKSNDPKPDLTPAG